MKKEIKTFIIDKFLQGEGTFEDDDLLHESGIINSMGFVKLLAFIEDTYDVYLDMGELSVDNFGTLNLITQMISSEIENK